MEKLTFNNSTLSTKKTNLCVDADLIISRIQTQFDDKGYKYNLAHLRNLHDRIEKITKPYKKRRSLAEQFGHLTSKGDLH